ncbi:SatD family protein [Anditalea andensis]|uniref:SatD family (SatD) n=1 Tax=Anditalea andensis TaxID=1048983 RepID=A0A074KY34_9BACT|nr:SatD family protein [Anditalea andensis]KEO73864.1 hypothetical protein EL17_10205 [Anditalea andensis]
MISVITGDIIHSKLHRPDLWLETLKTLLEDSSDIVGQWDIYRGDEFQIEVPDAENGLLMALLIKSAVKKTPTLDVRMSIGIGEKSYKGKKVSESNGPAFVHSGEQLAGMKKQKINMLFKSGNELLDKELNIIIKLGSVIWDNWSEVSAELALMLLQNPNQVQGKIAQTLGIKQAAVSQRFKRAEMALVLETEKYFKDRILNFKNE